MKSKKMLLVALVLVTCLLGILIGTIFVPGGSAELTGNALGLLFANNDTFPPSLILFCIALAAIAWLGSQGKKKKM